MTTRARHGEVKGAEGAGSRTGKGGNKQLLVLTGLGREPRGYILSKLPRKTRGRNKYGATQASGALSKPKKDSSRTVEVLRGRRS